MQIKKSDGKLVEVGCDFFADETVPDDFVIRHCMGGRDTPICPVFRECWIIYMRNPIQSVHLFPSISAGRAKVFRPSLMEGSTALG